MDLLRLLPYDLKLYVMSFHKNSQPCYLLNDIKSYLLSRKIIQDIYIERWIHWDFESPDDWLDNDLMGYMNNDIATMRGYEKRVFDIFLRHFMTRKYTREKLVKIFKNRHQNSKISNNIIWGLLTIEERNEFIVLESY